MTQAQLAKTSLAVLLKTLVQMPTITAEKATTRAALDWVKHQVRDLPLHVTDFEHNGYGALILTTRPTKHPKVLLSAHIDVIPAGPSEFTFREVDGRYYGRGVFDMKFAIAAYIQLLLELGDDLPRYDLGVVITSDEEDTGGREGAGPLVAAGWGGDVIIDPDAITPSWAVQRAGKGILRYRITSRGEAGHGSRTWLYRNAINQLMEYLQDLSARFVSEPCGDPDHVHPTLNVGTIHGGRVPNQVADKAYAEVDIRVMPGHTLAETVEFIQGVAEHHPHIGFEHIASDEAVSLDMNLECVTRIRRIITGVTGTHNRPVLSHGASEAGYYAAKGVPVILFNPPGGNHHAAGEWVDKQGVEQFAQIIRQFVEQEARGI
ncbi:MAG: hypothetical protein JWN01_358 [Patescibacteria group bacterium]|nr:hypothetical protein [Patescibacteria group bacterium]